MPKLLYVNVDGVTRLFVSQRSGTFRTLTHMIRNLRNASPHFVLNPVLKTRTRLSRVRRLTLVQPCGGEAYARPRGAAQRGREGAEGAEQRRGGRERARSRVDAAEAVGEARRRRQALCGALAWPRVSERCFWYFTTSSTVQNVSGALEPLQGLFVHRGLKRRLAPIPLRTSAHSHPPRASHRVATTTLAMPSTKNAVCTSWSSPDFECTS